MSRERLRDLLLAPHLEGDRVAGLLRPYGFSDPHAADRNLQEMARDPQARRLLAVVLPALLEALSRSADPDQALRLLERFLRASLGPIQVLSALRDRPRATETLALTLGGSPFMGEILIRHPTWFQWLTEPGVLDSRRPRAEIDAEIERTFEPLESEPGRRDLLRIAKRREILHVGVRDLLRLATVEETLTGLSEVAEALIERARRIALAEPAGTEGPRGGFTVLGLGKLGACELNFSSDVDLVFLYSSDRGRAGPSMSGRTEHSHALARRLTAVLTEVTPEGSVYRVDLRLRPEGRAGAIAHSLRSMAAYYATRGATWERLALLRAWPVAGDARLGHRLLRRLEAFVYGLPFGPEEVRHILRLKRETDRELARKGETDRHVKLGSGGIREIEFVVQTCQILHGGRLRADRRGTLAAIDALGAGGALPEEEAGVLRAGYLFLRDVENKLQMVSDSQVHALPTSETDLEACALRLGYRRTGESGARGGLVRDYRSHTEAVHGVFRRLFEEGRLGRRSLW